MTILFKKRNVSLFFTAVVLLLTAQIGFIKPTVVNAEETCPATRPSSNVVLRSNNAGGAVLGSYHNDGWNMESGGGAPTNVSLDVPSGTVIYFDNQTSGGSGPNRSIGGSQSYSGGVTVTGPSNKAGNYPSGYSFTRTNYVTGQTDPITSTKYMTVAYYQSCWGGFDDGVTMINITINVSSGGGGGGGTLNGSGATSLAIYDTPDVTFLVNGSSSATISAGTSANLSWTPTNTNSGSYCTASNAWSGAKSSTPGTTYTESTGVLSAGTYTYSLVCSGGLNSTSATKSVTLTVNPNAPTASITANGTTGSITIAYNAAATIAWNSTNATSCTVTPNGWTGISGSQSSGNLTSTVTYTLNCNGAGGNASASVTVNVSPAPDFSLNCTPATVTLNQGSTTSYSLSTTASNGFNSAVNFSTSFNPNSGTLPTVSYVNNGAVPNATTTVIITTTGLTSTGTYTITFTGSGGSQSHSCNVSLTVNSGLPPSPPVNITATNTAACSTVTVNWEAGSGNDSGVQYEIYKSTDNSNWSLLTSVPYQTGQSSYSHTDGAPSSGSNYYYVRAVKNTIASSNVYTTPVAPQPCSVNVDFSNKDLIQVNNNTASAGAGVNNRCNGQSDVFTLPNQGIFKDGDKAYFRINVCNNGNQAMTGITVTEAANISGLTNIAYESSYTSPAGCVTNANDVTRTYTVNDLGPAVNGNATICSFVLSATVTSGGGPAGELFRFQNIATISSAQTSKTIMTPKYLFSVGSGVPTRNETAP